MIVEDHPNVMVGQFEGQVCQMVDVGALIEQGRQYLGHAQLVVADGEVSPFGAIGKTQTADGGPIEMGVRALRQRNQFVDSRYRRHAEQQQPVASGGHLDEALFERLEQFQHRLGKTGISESAIQAGAQAASCIQLRQRLAGQQGMAGPQPLGDVGLATRERGGREQRAEHRFEPVIKQPGQHVAQAGAGNVEIAFCVDRFAARAQQNEPARAIARGDD